MISVCVSIMEVTLYSFNCFSVVTFCHSGCIYFELHAFIREGSGWFGFPQVAFVCISELLDLNGYLCVLYCLICCADV
jgi:hypothetical protein